ncbi:alpha/beta fold hydrolase [Paenibacillus silvae]|uniref:alpha/beta fold hydrolase n=1 Tax=Paenibacillus silvae TaxID=1325358 RepID=UPI0011A0D184|nr:MULTISPECIES: alpha/beta hydrolase [Paenibacillus]MCK6078536.1 alpha/beta hydrolase [Paenibacillus silvae]MCK6152856.1 alpha/beta hydrolase [Paenibacillus silvae]MCK6271308.1 alpha/beta hydrolase [Paenibacillus silvae]
MGRYVQVEPNVKVYVEDIGEGTPVLFLHGWPVNYKMFEYQLNVLPHHGIRTIAMDFRGYGLSDKPSTGYDYDRMADDVRAVIDDLGLKDAVLAGFSMGGAIAAHYMVRHQGHGISRLALLSAAAPVFTQREGYPYGLTPEELNEQIIEPIFEDRAKLLDTFGGMFFAKEHSKPFMNWFHALGMEASSYGTISSAMALRDEDLRGELETIQVPTAIFHGKKDEICPFEFAEQMHQAIPSAELVVFEESGHGAFYDELEKYNAELIRFIQS